MDLSWIFRSCLRSYTRTPSLPSQPSVASDTAAILDGGPPPAPAAAPAASTACAHCAAPARDRCASCRAVVYCDRDCQKAAWPAHKALCKAMLDFHHGGKPLASARDFVLEYWRLFIPSSIDVGALLSPADEELDEAAAFERCRGAAMDDFIPGYSEISSDGDRQRLVRAVIKQRSITRDSDPSLAEVAASCIQQLCPVALEAALRAGAQPGDALSTGATILQHVLAIIAVYPYVSSAHALPHALESLRLVLARAQPGDWLIGKPGHFPLARVAAMSDPSVSQAVLACILASPGGFPAHAVTTSAGALHMASELSTAVFVKALLDAGADPNVGAVERPDPSQTPLHALALGGDYEFDAKLALLLAAGARLEAVDSRGWTPIVVAAFNERIDAYDALLAAAAQVSALRVNIGDSPAAYSTVLHHLAWKNNVAMIQRVLATGVLEVDVRAGPGELKGTPLQWAASHDAPRAVGALLAAGASLAATDTGGFDALGLAIFSRSPKAARLLVEASPPTSHARYKCMAKTIVVICHRDSAAAPSDAAAAAKLAAAQAVAALFAA